MRMAIPKVLLAVLAVGLGAAMIPRVAYGASFLQAFSANHGQLRSQLTLGYYGPGSVPGIDDTTFDSGSALAWPPPTVTVATPFGFVLPLGGGATKDFVSGNLVTRLDFGTPFGPTPDDTLSFDLNTSLSAFASKNSAGNPADARAQATGTFDFFVDRFLPSGSLAGVLSLDPVPATGHVDVYQANLASGWTLVPVASLPGGAAGSTVPMFTDAEYLVKFSAQANVPFGTDPPFTVGWQARITAPEPSSLALLGVGSISVLTLLWRRRRLVEQAGNALVPWAESQ
jgi:hypothetical protein